MSESTFSVLITAMMRMVDSLVSNKETGRRMRSFLTNPFAYTNMKGMLEGLYDASTVKKFDMLKRYHHFGIVAKPGLLEDSSLKSLLFDKIELFEGHPNKSFVDILGGADRFPKESGVMTLFFTPFSERVDRLYMRRKNPSFTITPEYGAV